MWLLDPSISLWLLLLVASMAILYSSVGHGGASGYLAAMALFGLEPAMMKPAALTMNIFVTVLVLWRVSRTGPSNWRLLLPFAMASVPMAFIGGAYTINSSIYRVMVGLALLLAMWRLLWEGDDSDRIQAPVLWIALPVGAGLGLVSGLTGVGGGIFLSPLLLLFHWTTMRGSVAIAAAFILLNSTCRLCHDCKCMAGRYSDAGACRCIRCADRVGTRSAASPTRSPEKCAGNCAAGCRCQDDRHCLAGFQSGVANA
jgi:uncharacterized membrane protein YfcA